MQSQFTQTNTFLPLEKSLKEFMELNAKTIQGFSYINPTELMSSRKPEQLMEKNVDVMIQNGHKALDYMHDVFNLMEKNWLNISGTIMERTKETMGRTQTVTGSTMNDAAKNSQTSVKKAASAVKATTKSSTRKKPAVTKMSSSKTTGSKLTSGKSTVAKKTTSRSTSRPAQTARKIEAAKSPVISKDHSLKLSMNPVSTKE